MAEDTPAEKKITPDELLRRIKALEDKKVQIRFPVETDINPAVVYLSNASSNTEDPLSHDLKRVPVGYIVVSQDAVGNIYSNYSGMTTWTTTKIFVKCSAASMTAKLLLF